MSIKKWSTALLLLVGLCPMVFGWENPNGFSISTASGSQNTPQIAADGYEGAIITWNDYRNGTDCDVYAQGIDNVGDVRWDTDGILISGGIGDQIQPKIVKDQNYGAYILWADFRNGTDYNLYLQKISYGGVLQYTEGGKSICTESGNQENAQIAEDGTGGALMVWQDYRSGLGTDIYAQSISWEDNLLFAANGAPVCTASGEQTAPKIISDSWGGSIIVWEDERNSFMSGKDIYAQALDANGNIRWQANGIPISTAGGDQSNVQIVPDQYGGAFICWQSVIPYSGYIAIMVQAVDSTGQIKWDSNGVCISTSTYTDQINPVMAVGNMPGKAFIAWEDYRNGDADIFAQEIDNSESRMWSFGSGLSVCTASSQQTTPQIVSDNSGNAIITWTDYRSNDYCNIYAQKISWAGTAWADNGIALNPTKKVQYQPAPISVGFGGAVIAWTDNRNADDDIYVQSITDTGFVPVELSEFSIE